MDKLHLYDKILSPLVTEKTTNLSEQNKIVFKVPSSANKKNLKSNFISIPLFLFLIWIFVGIGFNSILLGLALFSLSIPIYFYQKYYARNRKS